MKKVLFILVIIAMSTMMTSCEKSISSPEQEIKSKIIGKWKVVSTSLGQQLTNRQRVNTYYPDGKMYFSESRTRAGIFYWHNKKEADYAISLDTLIQSYNYESTEDDKFIITSINSDEMNFKCLKPGQGGKLTDMKLTRVTADYSSSIVGLWKGVSYEGEETFGDANHLWQYKADGTFVYYEKDSISGFKPKDGQVISEYNVDGDWLATRWMNVSDSVMNYEWWDIETCNDTMMVWTALRERTDGSRFTATFTMKRVAE